jgi:hypothetical protein
MIGDGVNSGLIGLAYPGLTSVFNGTNPDNDTFSDVDTYDPFFFTAIKEGAVSEPSSSYTLLNFWFEFNTLSYPLQFSLSLLTADPSLLRRVLPTIPISDT